MAEPTNAQILSAITTAIAALYITEPEETWDGETEDVALVPLDVPATLGSTKTSGVLNGWFTQACHQAEGVEVDTDMQATVTRVAAFMRDPEHLRTLVQRVMGVDFIWAPIMTLPEDDEGNLLVKREDLEPALLAAAKLFYELDSEFDKNYDDVMSADSMAEMFAALTKLYGVGSDTVVFYNRHIMIEVFEYWDMLPDDRLIVFVSQYFLCTQLEQDYIEALDKQMAKKKAEAEAAAKVAEKAATSKQSANTVSKIAAVPATQDAT